MGVLLLVVAGVLVFPVMAGVVTHRPHDFLELRNLKDVMVVQAVAGYLQLKVPGEVLVSGLCVPPVALSRRLRLDTFTHGVDNTYAQIVLVI